jgi:hypothetical protein
VGGLFAELGKKLAERWLSLLVLPGALYLVVAFAAYTLGQAHPFATGRIVDRVTALTSLPGPGTQVALLLVTLAGAAAVGLVAQALGSGIERVALAADWPGWPAPARRLADRALRRRQQRWDAAARAYEVRRDEAARTRARGGRADPAPRNEAWRQMARIAAERPGRPTALSDRIHAVATRLDRDLNVDLAVVWPYLWLTLPEVTRTEVTAARQALSRAAVLAAWAVLYLLLAVWWWPAAPVAAVVAAVSVVRLRPATEAYAVLLEAATRLHLSELARHLGLDSVGPATAELGDSITRLLTGQQRPSEK